MDLRANIDEDMFLMPLERTIMGMGLFIEPPDGFEAQIRPQSRLAIKKGITVLNSPGTIDADYRGEICIVLINLSKKKIVIGDGERICQKIIAKHEKFSRKEAEVLIENNRGDGDFGHTLKE
jgi:dUTP pyrophosphatase